MPILEYECKKCGRKFDHLERHSSSAPECPACRSRDLKKLISLSAVSSDQTQKRALKGAEQRTAGQRYERAYEDHKEAHEHED